MTFTRTALTLAALLMVSGVAYAAPLGQTGGGYDTINAIVAFSGLGIGVLVVVAFIVSRLPNSQSSNDAVSKLASALSDDAKSRTEQTKLEREIHEQRKKELETISSAATKLQSAVEESNSKWIELSTRHLNLMDEGISTNRALRDSVNDGNRDHETRAAAFRTETLSRLDALASKVDELSKEVLGADNKPSIKGILTTIFDEITGLRADLNRLPEAIAAPEGEPSAEIPAGDVNINANTVNVTEAKKEPADAQSTKLPANTPDRPAVDHGGDSERPDTGTDGSTNA